MFDYTVWQFRDLFWVLAAVLSGIIQFVLSHAKESKSIRKWMAALTDNEVAVMKKRLRAILFWISLLGLVGIISYLVTKGIFTILKFIGVQVDWVNYQWLGFLVWGCLFFILPIWAKIYNYKKAKEHACNPMPQNINIDIDKDSLKQVAEGLDRAREANNALYASIDTLIQEIRQEREGRNRSK